MRYIVTFLLKIIPFAAIYAAIYIPARLLSIKKPVALRDEILRLLLHLSVIAILSQTVTPSGNLSDFRFEISRAWDYYNFVPFAALARLIAGGKGIEYFFIINILGNFCVFMPTGFLAVLLHRGGVWRATALGAGLSLFIEVFQIFLPRTTDIDDLIMNTVGTLLGALAGAAFLAVCRRAQRKKSAGR